MQMQAPTSSHFHTCYFCLEGLKDLENPPAEKWCNGTGFIGVLASFLT